MSDAEELTFIQKIEKYRKFAHRPISSDSELSNDQQQKSESSNESNNSYGDCKKNSTAEQEKSFPYTCKEQRQGENSNIAGSDQTDDTKSLFNTEMKIVSANCVLNQDTSIGDHEDEASEDGEPLSQMRTLITPQSSGAEEELGIDGKRDTGLETYDDNNACSNDYGPGDIFYINENTSQLIAFKTIDELSQYLTEKRSKRKDNNSNHSLVTPLLGMSVRAILNHVTVGEYIRHLHARDELVDVMIDVRGEKFPAHRVTLCSHSSYFSNLFSQAKSNKIPFDLKINGISAHAFASFLEFCYTGEMTVYPEIAADLLIVADYLQVKQLKKRCSLIAGSLPIDQTLKFIVNSSPNNPHKLYKNLFQHVLRNFGSATKFEEFLEMNVETLCNFISSDDLKVESEFEAFQAVVRWIIHNIEDRVKYTMRLMSHIRFCHMPSRDLHACAETAGLIRNYEKFREIILIANWQISSRQLGREDPFNFPILKARNCFISQIQNGSDTLPSTLITQNQIKTTPTLDTTSRYSEELAGMKPQKYLVEDILMINGRRVKGQEQTEYVQRYDTQDNQWVRFCKRPVDKKGHMIVALKDKLFLIGGNGPTATDEKPETTEAVYMLDISKKTWTRVADMIIARHNHCACVARGKIYVIGGKDRDNRVLRSVECYDQNIDKWMEVDPINSPRYGACATMYSGKIFVTGGLGEDNEGSSTLPVLNTVECYDIDNKCWNRLTNLRLPRCYANLVSIEDRLFLCCGARRSYNYRSSILVSVASIDEYDATDDVWTHVTDMVIPRHQAGVTAIGDRIYIIGGISTVADRCLQSVECYDCRTGKWSSGIADLPEPAASIGCVSITSKWQIPTEKFTPAFV